MDDIFDSKLKKEDSETGINVFNLKSLITGNDKENNDDKDNDDYVEDSDYEEENEGYEYDEGEYDTECQIRVLA